MENSKKVLNFGVNCVEFSRKGLKICGIGVPILLLVFFIAHLILGDTETFIEAFFFDFHMADGIQAIVVVLIYLGILMLLICLAVYLYGMKLVGIGQTAYNTSEIAELLKVKDKLEEK